MVDETVGWDHRLNGHEFEQALGDSEGQGSTACCSPWGCKESATEQQQRYKEGSGEDKPETELWRDFYAQLRNSDCIWLVLGVHWKKKNAT